jgi:hypothetical protein
MINGASMYAACRRPDISDSLSSGQPLYLLNSKSGAVSHLRPVAIAEHATGSVRLHVTGSPPTSSGFAALCANESVPAEIKAAPVPSSNCLRRRKWAVGAWLSLIALLDRKRVFDTSFYARGACRTNRRATRIQPHFDQQCGRPDKGKARNTARRRSGSSRRTISSDATANATTHCPVFERTVVLGSVIMKKMKSWYIGPRYRRNFGLARGCP